MNNDDPILDLITQARVSLLMNKPFFGNLALHLTPVDATKWLETAATDGRRLYYNRDFIKKLTPQELIFLIAHEIMHVVYDHLGRTGRRDRKLFNMANDYIVNYTLVKENVGKMPAKGLYSDKYTDEMTSEEVYDLLEKNSTKIEYNFDEHLEDMPSEGGGDGEGSKDGEGKGKKVTVTVTGEDGPPVISEAEREEIRNSIRNAVLSAAQNCDAGHVPAGIRRLIEEFSDPIMDWRTLLELHIQSSIKDDFTFQRPNRRSHSCGCILPGQNFANTVDVAVSIDTSGSMTDDMLRDFLAEVKGIMDTFDDFKLTLWTFDTQVYHPVVFTPSNIDEILSYVPEGGGGTMFEANWEFMRDPDGYSNGRFDTSEFQEAIEPKKFVMFTDGYPCGTWGDEEYCDTLFVVHGSTSIVAPFGQTAYYIKDEKRT